MIALPRVTTVALVVAAQALLVGVAVADQLSARTTGTEYLLRVAPVDPIDPFRGAYVDLGYPDLPAQPNNGGAPLPEKEPTSEPDAEPADQPRRGTAYVPLTQKGAVWVGGDIVRSRPAAGPYLTCNDRSWRLRCGIESWFLPQQRAASVQTWLGQGHAVARVKIDSRGNAALIDVVADN